MRELRQNASAVLRRVASGESITVTDRGHPVARLVPLSRGSGVSALVEAGQAVLPQRPFLEAPAAVTPEPGGVTAAQALAELRSDER